MALKKIKEINLEKSLFSMILLNAFGLVLFFLSAIAFTLVLRHLRQWLGNPLPKELTISFALKDLLIFLLVFVLLLMTHELIHGLFFKLFAPNRPLRFGFHWYALTASSPQTIYSKGKFFWIGIAPFVLLTLVLTCLAAVGLLAAELYLLLISFHTAGCIGDFYFCWVLLRAPSGAVAEDTGIGLILYQQE